MNWASGLCAEPLCPTSACLPFRHFIWSTMERRCIWPGTVLSCIRLRFGAVQVPSQGRMCTAECEVGYDGAPEVCPLSVTVSCWGFTMKIAKSSPPESEFCVIEGFAMGPHAKKRKAIQIPAAEVWALPAVHMPVGTTAPVKHMKSGVIAACFNTLTMSHAHAVFMKEIV